MRRRRWPWYAPLGCCLLFAPAAQGQGLLGRTQPGEVGIQYLGLDRGRVGFPRTSDDTFREWLSLPFDGSLVDPQLLSWSLVLRPTLSQRRSTGLPDGLNTRELSYQFSSQILQGRRLSLTASANASSGSTSGGLGSSGEFNTTARGLDIQFRNAWLPLRAGYRTTSRRNRWVTSSIRLPIEWSNSDRMLQVLGEGRKTRFSIQHMDFTDRLGPNDFSVLTMGVTHTARWGKGSRLRSSLDRTDREGSIQSDRFTWREALTLKHTENTTSTHSYRRSRVRTAMGRSTLGNWSTGIRSQLLEWLTVGGQYGGTRTRFDGSLDDVRSWAPQADLSFRFARRGRITLGGAVGREHRTRRGIVGQAVSVLDEPQSVDASRVFRLDQLGADPTSVVIEREDRTLVYVRGLDYEILALERVVEVVIPPGSRISEGETVLVSYRFTLEDLPSGDLTTTRFYGSLSLWGLTASYNESRREVDESEPGLDFSLGASEEASAALRGRWSVFGAAVDVGARRRRRETATLRYDVEEADGNVSWPLWRGGPQLSAGASTRRAMDRGGALRSDAVFGAVVWPIARQVRFHGRVQTLRFELENGSLSRALGTTGDLTFQLGETDVLLRHQYDRQTAPVRYRGSRLSIRMVRRF
ncbi:MAG: hypothetical protein OEO23_11095 [Gemmatimonadota bacterium]|nr:hypothetical protein [Gemmatimonadota bacterium]